MLILSRKENQSIVIGDNIVVTVTEIDGDRVRLGVTADRAVPVDREEVRRRKLGDVWGGDGEAEEGPDHA